jgi:hypothetical protein
MVILAAGMGSRYGGLKQIDPVGPHGELIIDYSVYDAIKAGFEKVVFIIKREMEKDFMEVIGSRISKRIESVLAYQEIDRLPAGFSVPQGRVKPWGTAHALLSIKNAVNGPFAAINSDDYYGTSAFKTIYDWFSKPEAQTTDGKQHFSMVGYRIENTVSEYGSVARGVCTDDGNGFLKSITERTNVEKSPEGARYSEDGGKTWNIIPSGTLVSMNFWGLNETFLNRSDRDFPEFLETNLPVNPQTCEYRLPFEVDLQLKNGEADVTVLGSDDSWYGVTYKNDRPNVVKAIASMHESGKYPSPLWG